MNFKGLLLIITLVIWSAISWYWYTCKVKGFCNPTIDRYTQIFKSNDDLSVNASDNSVSDSSQSLIEQNNSIPFGFKWGDPNFYGCNENLWTHIDSIVLTLHRGQYLYIVGKYFTNEMQTDGSENMGWQRVRMFKNRLGEVGIDTSYIKISAIAFENMDTTYSEYFEAIEYANTKPLAFISKKNQPESELKQYDSNKEVKPLEKVKEKIPAIKKIEQIPHGIMIHYGMGENAIIVNKELSNYLARMAENCNRQNIKVLITGHTDSEGDDNNNISLGLYKALEVRKEFVKQGMSEGAIEVESMGETKPIAPNTSLYGRLKNRRVVIKKLNN